MYISPIQNNNLNKNQLTFRKAHLKNISVINDCYFTSQEKKLRFFNGFGKLSEFEINLEEILDFGNMNEKTKKITKDFFNILGEDEVKDYSVEIEIIPTYTQTNDIWYKSIYEFTTNIKGKVPRNHKHEPPEDSLKECTIVSIGKDNINQLRKNKHSFTEYDSGKGFPPEGELGARIWLPAQDELKNMIKEKLMKHINNCQWY